MFAVSSLYLDSSLRVAKKLENLNGLQIVILTSYDMISCNGQCIGHPSDQSFVHNYEYMTVRDIDAGKYT